jgi:hypothetical protein
MTNRWRVEILDDEPRTADDGRVIYVRIRQPILRVGVAGYVVMYEGETPFTDEITVNDFFLPSATARRLLASVYVTLGPSIGEYGDVGIVVDADLFDLIDDSYLVGGKETKALIQAPIRTFFT